MTDELSSNSPTGDISRLPGGGEQQAIQTIEPGNNSNAGASLAALKQQQEAELALFSGKAAIILSVLMNLSAFYAYVWFKWHGLDFPVPEWAMGLMLTPIGGGTYIWIKHRLPKRG